MHEIIKLSNGLRVVLENISHVKSVTAGVWIGAGSYRETAGNNGISHFIEHMLFKGTKNRTAKQIAEEIDDIGGQINAFTGRDCTCFYAKVLFNHVDIAVDVISDMLFNSLFDDGDLALERSVVAEEISMYEDAPEEVVHDLLTEQAWRGSPFGQSILGTKEILESITKENIQAYMAENYTPENSVFSVVGSFERGRLIALLEEKFGGWASSSAPLGVIDVPKFYSAHAEVSKDIEQAHLCLGYKAIERGHELAYPLMVVNTILGSGMSSRLFQNIREEKGLVYSIYSYQSIFEETGLFTIYAGMNPARLGQVRELIEAEIKRLKTDSISDYELQKCKEQLKGSLILGLESTSARMHSFGQSLLLTGRIQTLDETVEKIDSVDLDKVRRVIKLVFDSEPAAAIVRRK